VLDRTARERLALAVELHENTNPNYNQIFDFVSRTLPASMSLRDSSARFQHAFLHLGDGVRLELRSVLGHHVASAPVRRARQASVHAQAQRKGHVKLTVEARGSRVTGQNEER
jgi:hypothetical protein